jgi:hypothetical protein
MKTINWKMIVGIGLLLLGSLTLLDTFNLIPGMENLWTWMIAGIFGLAGAVFLYAVVIDRQENWWAVIPGMVLLGLGLTIVASSFRLLDNLIGSIFLGSISAAFWIVYLMNRKHWWGIIPGGVLATLALVTGADDVLAGYTGVLFFLGLSATFALVALMPKGGEKMSWPWIPAAVMFALASVIAISAENMLQYLWPVGLILAGLIMVGRTIFKKA